MLTFSKRLPLGDEVDPEAGTLLNDAAAVDDAAGPLTTPATVLRMPVSSYSAGYYGLKDWVEQGCDVRVQTMRAALFNHLRERNCPAIKPGATEIELRIDEPTEQLGRGRFFLFARDDLTERIADSSAWDRS